MTGRGDLSAEAASVFGVYRWMGVSEEGAMDLLRQDGLLPESGFDGFAGSLGRIFGLSEGAARVGAAGRGSVSEAVAGSASSRDVFEAARRTLDSMSDVEVNEVLEGRRRRKASKKTAPSGGSAKKQTTVSEWGRRR